MDAGPEGADSTSSCQHWRMTRQGTDLRWCVGLGGVWGSEGSRGPSGPMTPGKIDERGSAQGYFARVQRSCCCERIEVQREVRGQTTCSAGFETRFAPLHVLYKELLPDPKRRHFFSFAANHEAIGFTVFKWFRQVNQTN